MTPPQGYLASHPLPPGVAGALNVSGYQLLAEVAGVGTGRLGRQIFLLYAADPDDAVPEPMTQMVLHQNKLRDERDAPSFTAVAAQLGYLRLSGYRIVPERDGMRTHLQVVDPATGGIAVKIPSHHPPRLTIGYNPTAQYLLQALKALPQAGPPADPERPELVREAILALALSDENTSGAEAADLADRAYALVRSDPSLDPRTALIAARSGGGK